MTTYKHVRVVAALTAMSVSACASGADAHQARASTTDNADAPVALVTTAAITQAAPPAGAVRFLVAPSGNAARFRVREQLLGHDLPNDAVGETQQITGAITVDSKGALVPGQSLFVVQVTSLKSDSDRRDGFVQHRLLETDKYPTVELVPIAIRGLVTVPSATSAVGPVTVDVVGNLTVRGVTHLTTWRVTARQANGQVTGSASTKFTFTDFAINPPKVPVLLSVADTIALEYDFTLTRDTLTSPH